MTINISKYRPTCCCSEHEISGLVVRILTTVGLALQYSLVIYIVELDWLFLYTCVVFIAVDSVYYNAIRYNHSIPIAHKVVNGQILIVLAMLMIHKLDTCKL